MRRKNRPEQLRLELDWSLLEQLETSGEGLDSYEQSTRSLCRATVQHMVQSPVMAEIILHGKG